MFYLKCQALLVKGLIRVEGRPDGIHILARSFGHRFLVKCLSRNERLMLAGLQVERRKQSESTSQVSPADLDAQVLPIKEPATDKPPGNPMQRQSLPNAANY